MHYNTETLPMKPHTVIHPSENYEGLNRPPRTPLKYKQGQIRWYSLAIVRQIIKTGLGMPLDRHIYPVAWPTPGLVQIRESSHQKGSAFLMIFQYRIGPRLLFWPFEQPEEHSGSAPGKRDGWLASGYLLLLAEQSGDGASECSCLLLPKSLHLGLL